MDNWSVKNQTSTDGLLIHYFITDYICCGLSSPSYYSEFQKTLQSDKSKIRLLKDLLKNWDYLFKHYSINCKYKCNIVNFVLTYTCMYVPINYIILLILGTNIDFVKKIVDSLERLFVMISNLIPDNNNKLQYNNVLDKIKHFIKLYEHYNSGMHTPHTSINDIGIKNKVPKETNELEGHLSQQSLGQSMKTSTNQKIQNVENKKHLALNNEQDRNLNLKNSESFTDHHLSIKPKPISNNVQNLLNNTKNGMLIFSAYNLITIKFIIRKNYIQLQFVKCLN